MEVGIALLKLEILDVTREELGKFRVSLEYSPIQIGDLMPENMVQKHSMQTVEHNVAAIEKDQ